MNKRRSSKHWLWLAVLALGLTLGGCKTMDPAESELPWGQPKDFEQQAPGMPPISQGKY